MPIIYKILGLANTDSVPAPAQRKCPWCHRLGAHCHGCYFRNPPGRNFCPKQERIRVPRFLCLSCRRTFSQLLFCLIRRVGIRLPCLLALAQSDQPWALLEKIFEISRPTLWRWRRLGRRLLKAISAIPALESFSWSALSDLLSHIQYPFGLRELHPTIAVESTDGAGSDRIGARRFT